MVRTRGQTKQKRVYTFTHVFVFGRPIIAFHSSLHTDDDHPHFPHRPHRRPRPAPLRLRRRPGPHPRRHTLHGGVGPPRAPWYRSVGVVPLRGGRALGAVRVAVRVGRSAQAAA